MVVDTDSCSEHLSVVQPPPLQYGRVGPWDLVQEEAVVGGGSPPCSEGPEAPGSEVREAFRLVNGHFTATGGKTASHYG